jgi:hypothetical protein
MSHAAAGAARRAAREDPAIRVVVVTRRPLWYAEGAAPALDRPFHVRAGSGLAWLDVPGAGPRLVVAQDDASFLGVLDPEPGEVCALTLDHVDRGMRQFDAARGNKKRKLDLEACCTIQRGGQALVLAFGSGSLPARERVVVVEPGKRPRIVDASALYAALRACTTFAGSELNVEGAAVIGDSLRLFQRGNGAPRGGLRPTDATCDLDLEALLAYLDDPALPPPVPRSPVEWDLGSIRGCRLTFTDACAGRGGVAFLAAAEASPDAVEDGEVVGVALGWIPEGEGEARWGLVREPDGAPFLGKCEGLAWARGAPVASGRIRAWAVVDRDDPDVPSELCALEIEGLPGGP